MKKIFLTLCISVFVISCSGVKSTLDFSAEEHLNYAKSLYEEEDYDESLIEFQSILMKFPGSTVVDDAQYYFGMSYYKSYKYLNAAYEFSKLIRDIPASEYVPEAQFMLAESYYKLSPPYPLEQSYTRKAIQEYQAFIEFFPINDKVAEAETKIKEMNYKLAEKEFNTANIYKRMEYYIAATEYYTHVFEEYHDTKFAPLALYEKINLLVSRDKFDEALSSIKIFLNKYPDNDNKSEITELEADIKNR